MWKLILIILAVLYTLNPYDILPDLMVGWGWLDDLVVWGLLWRYLALQKKKRSLILSAFINTPTVAFKTMAGETPATQISTPRMPGTLIKFWALIAVRPRRR